MVCQYQRTKNLANTRSHVKKLYKLDNEIEGLGHESLIHSCAIYGMPMFKNKKLQVGHEYAQTNGQSE